MQVVPMVVCIRGPRRRRRVRRSRPIRGPSGVLSYNSNDRKRWRWSFLIAKCNTSVFWSYPIINTTCIGPFDIVLGHSQGACLVVAMDCLRTRPGDFHQWFMSHKSSFATEIEILLFFMTLFLFVFSFFYSSDFLSTLLNADDLDETDKDKKSKEKLMLPDAALSIVIGGFVPRLL